MLPLVKLIMTLPFKKGVHSIVSESVKFLIICGIVKSSNVIVSCSSHKTSDSDDKYVECYISNTIYIHLLSVTTVQPSESLTLCYHVSRIPGTPL